MSQKPQIRIVKRGRQGEEKGPAGVRQVSERETRRGARDVADKVSSWVEEFKERRGADDFRSFASLFSERAGRAAV